MECEKIVLHNLPWKTSEEEIEVFLNNLVNVQLNVTNLIIHCPKAPKIPGQYKTLMSFITLSSHREQDMIMKAYSARNEELVFFNNEGLSSVINISYFKTKPEKIKNKAAGANYFTETEKRSVKQNKNSHVEYKNSHFGYNSPELHVQPGTGNVIKDVIHVTDLEVLKQLSLGKTQTEDNKETIYGNIKTLETSLKETSMNNEDINLQLLVSPLEVYKLQCELCEMERKIVNKKLFIETAREEYFKLKKQFDLLETLV